MKKSNPIVSALSNIQILSALIWAFTIIGCGWVGEDNNLSTILITAAGFHVVLLARFEKKRLN